MSESRNPDSGTQMSRYHAQDGVCFERWEGGYVVLFTDAKGEHPRLVLSPETWASVVAFVSAAGESGPTYAQAFAFHQNSSVNVANRDSGASLMSLLKRLSELYKPEGVYVWLTNHHRLLGCSPAEAWDLGRQVQVLALVAQMEDGAFV